MWCVLSKGLAYFRQIMPKPHSAHIPPAWLHLRPAPHWERLDVTLSKVWKQDCFQQVCGSMINRPNTASNSKSKRKSPFTNGEQIKGKWCRMFRVSCYTLLNRGQRRCCRRKKLFFSSILLSKWTNLDPKRSRATSPHCDESHCHCWVKSNI